MNTRKLELLARKLALKDAELATYTQTSFDMWLKVQYENIEKELAELNKEGEDLL